MSWICHSWLRSEGTAGGLSYQCFPHGQEENPIPPKVRWQRCDNGKNGVHVGGTWLVPAIVGTHACDLPHCAPSHCLSSPETMQTLKCRPSRDSEPITKFLQVSGLPLGDIKSLN